MVTCAICHAYSVPWLVMIPADSAASEPNFSGPKQPGARSVPGGLLHPLQVVSPLCRHTSVRSVYFRNKTIFSTCEMGVLGFG